MRVQQFERPEQASATAKGHGDQCEPGLALHHGEVLFLPACGNPNCRFAIYTWHDSVCFNCRRIDSFV